MNCEDFNNILAELADYRPMPAETRDEGVSHAALCAGCARKLVDARALSANLLHAAGAESEVAPARVKENVLAAFVAQREAETLSQSVVDISSRSKSFWWTAAAAAIAAVIVLAVLLPGWRKQPPTVAPPDFVKAPPVEIPTIKPIETPEAPPVNRPSNRPAGTSEAAINRRPFRSVTQREKARQGTSETVAQNTSSEYLPLTYLATATAMDTGTVVRVRLSRAALVSLGIPVNIESQSDSVRADIVVGDDGVARAIRLVQ